MDDRLLTTRDVSEILGIDPGTLKMWRYRKDKRLPWLKLGRLVRYRASDVQRIMALGFDDEGGE